MNIMQRKTIGLLMGNGTVVRKVWSSLNERHTVVPVGLVPGADAMLDQHTKVFGVGQVPEICEYLNSKGVTEIVFAGDLGLVKNQDEGKLAQALLDGDTVTDLTIRRLLKDKAPVEKIVNRIGQIISHAGIQLKHVNEIVSDFQIGEGWISEPEAAKISTLTEQIEHIRQELLAIRETQQHALERSAIVFDGKKMIGLPDQSTDDLLASVEDIRKQKGAIRSFVKVSTAASVTNLAAPVIGAGTVEMCQRSGVDLIILDSRNGLIVDIDECLRLCRSHKISIFGMSL